MGIDYVKLGYDNAKEEAEMEAQLLAIVKADMAKPRVYIPVERPMEPWSHTIADIIVLVVKFVIGIFLFSFMACIMDIAMGGYYN